MGSLQRGVELPYLIEVPPEAARAPGTGQAELEVDGILIDHIIELVKRRSRLDFQPVGSIIRGR